MEFLHHRPSDQCVCSATWFSISAELTMTTSLTQPYKLQSQVVNLNEITISVMPCFIEHSI